MKLALPWICVVALAIGLGWAYTASLKKDAELAALREDSQQLQKLRAEQEETKGTRTQIESEELARLRKTSEDLPRLRNEVSQLRKENQRLAAQVQSAQGQVQGAQAQIQALRVNPPQSTVPAQPNPGAQPALAGQPGAPAQTAEQQQATACINNLRMIDAAKQQWALQKQRPAGSLLTAADLAPYLRSNTVPVCPAGGVYTLNPVGIPPLCNIPGHALAK